MNKKPQTVEERMNWQFKAKECEPDEMVMPIKCVESIVDTLQTEKEEMMRESIQVIDEIGSQIWNDESVSQDVQMGVEYIYDRVKAIAQKHGIDLTTKQE